MLKSINFGAIAKTQTIVVLLLVVLASMLLARPTEAQEETGVYYGGYITSGPADGSTVGTNYVTFGFTSPSGTAKTWCGLYSYKLDDDLSYGECTSPKDYSRIPAGWHEFYVEFYDSSGNYIDDDWVEFKVVAPKIFLAATPEDIEPGGTTKLDGKLLSPTGEALKGKQVTIEERPAGENTWTTTSTQPKLTDSYGKFSLSNLKPSATTVYRAGYQGSYSPLQEVTVFAEPQWGGEPPPGPETDSAVWAPAGFNKAGLRPTCAGYTCYLGDKDYGDNDFATILTTAQTKEFASRMSLAWPSKSTYCKTVPGSGRAFTYLNRACLAARAWGWAQKAQVKAFMSAAARTSSCGIVVVDGPGNNWLRKSDKVKPATYYWTNSDPAGGHQAEFVIDVPLGEKAYVKANDGTYVVMSCLS